MNDLFELSARNMQKTMDQWEKMMTGFPCLNGLDAPLLKWNPGLTAMRSTFEINMRAWKTFIEHNETTFFRVLDITPFRNQAAESQLRASWDSVKKAMNTYQEIVEAQFQKMEELTKKDSGQM